MQAVGDNAVVAQQPVRCSSLCSLVMPFHHSNRVWLKSKV
jgi:hypothetical protein